MKVKKLFVLLIILNFTSGFGQSLEDAVYDVLDSFIENPSPSSLEQLEEKETLFSKQATTADEFLALVVLNSNMGYYHRQFGNHQKAIKNYEKAWKYYREKQLVGYDITEYCLKPLGNLYTITGDFTNAESIIKSYLSFAEKQNNNAQKIAGILNLSVVYHNTGKHNTAIELLEEGLQKSGLNNQQKLALENNLATNLIALKQFEKAQTLLEVQNNFSSFRNSAQIAVQQGEFDKALAILEEAESSLSKTPPLARDLARFYVEKASIYSGKKETQKAIETFHIALQTLIPTISIDEIPDTETLYAENTFLSIFDGLAYLQKNEVEALNYYELSFYVSGLLYEQFTDQEVKIMHQAAWKRRTERCLEILFNQFEKTKDFKFIVRAFEYAEKSKATVLRESSSQRTLLETHPEDSLLQERAYLNHLQEQKINELIREQLTTQNFEKLQALNDTLSIINLTLRELKTKISQKYPDTISSVVSLKEVQAKSTEDKAVLISYFFGKENLYRFEISENEVYFHKTEVDKNLSESIIGFMSYFENSSAINNDIAGFQKLAFSLFKTLLPKTLPQDKNLILIPDGLLHFIPFEALLTSSTQITSYTGMPFLVKQNTVSYNTSATLYNRAKTPEAKNSVLGVFPVFENSAQALNYSLAEAESLNKLMNTKLLMHQQASKENFLAFAKAHSILHLSTHAHSGNFTIPAAMEFYDDVMLLQEFYSLNLNPKLVVLSACETGVGKIQTGEGAMSLARGFQYAGAQNLLFSLWQVNDLSTSQLMTSFYENYSKTHSAFIANRQSKLDYLKNKDISNAKKSPYYWSGFVYYGAMEEQQKTSAYSIWVIGFLGILALIWYIKRKINRVKKKK